MGAQENRGGRGEPGENKKNFTIFCNILQKKENKEAGNPMEGGGKRE